jgi:transcriptional regulator with XRE-family HTH domain
VEFPAWSLVAEARRRAGLTQVQLAERAGTSQAAIARYERAETLPSLATLQRLVRACGFDLRTRLELYDGHDDALMDARLAMSPEERIRANEEGNRTVAALQDAAAG